MREYCASNQDHRHTHTHSTPRDTQIYVSESVYRNLSNPDTMLSQSGLYIAVYSVSAGRFMFFFSGPTVMYTFCDPSINATGSG
jgi:hypothetical protein